MKNKDIYDLRDLVFEGSGYQSLDGHYNLKIKKCNGKTINYIDEPTMEEVYISLKNWLEEETYVFTADEFEWLRRLYSLFLGGTYCTIQFENNSHYNKSNIIEYRVELRDDFGGLAVYTGEFPVGNNFEKLDMNKKYNVKTLIENSVIKDEE